MNIWCATSYVPLNPLLHKVLEILKRRHYCCCNVLSASKLFHSLEASEETLCCCCNVLSVRASECDSDNQTSKEWQTSEVVLWSWRFWRSQVRQLKLSRFWLRILKTLKILKILKTSSQITDAVNILTQGLKSLNPAPYLFTLCFNHLSSEANEFEDKIEMGTSNNFSTTWFHGQR